MKFQKFHLRLSVKIKQQREFEKCVCQQEQEKTQRSKVTVKKRQLKMDFMGKRRERKQTMVRDSPHVEDESKTEVFNINVIKKQRNEHSEAWWWQHHAVGMFSIRRETGQN